MSPTLSQQEMLDVVHQFALETQARRDYFIALSNIANGPYEETADGMQESIENAVSQIAQTLQNLGGAAVFMSEHVTHVVPISGVGIEESEGIVLMVKGGNDHEVLNLSAVQRIVPQTKIALYRQSGFVY